MNKRILKLSKDLISIPSVTGDHKNCDEVLGVALRELAGFKHKTYKYNKVKSSLFYNTSSFPKEFKVILNGHVDVVPAEKHQFKPKVMGNKLIGRGTYDMKAATAVLILVYKELAKKVNYPLGLQLVTDEEVGGYDGTGYQVKKGVRTEFVLCGEPTDLHIGYKNRATYWIKLVANGKSGHGAYPWHANNALEILLYDIIKIKNEYKNPKTQQWKTSVSVTNIKTDNETINKIPSYAEALLDIRPIPKDYGKVKKFVKNSISKYTKLEALSDATYHNIESDNKYFIALQKSIEKKTSKKPVLIEKYGGNDLVHHYETGSKGVLFGPKGGGMHSNDEWVNIKSLETYYEILNNFLLKV